MRIFCAEFFSAESGKWKKKKTAEIFFAESDNPTVEKNFADFFFADFFLRMRKFEKKILRNFFFADSGNPAVKKNFAEKKLRI